MTIAIPRAYLAAHRAGDIATVAVVVVDGQVVVVVDGRVVFVVDGRVVFVVDGRVVFVVDGRVVAVVDGRVVFVVDGRVVAVVDGRVVAATEVVVLVAVGAFLVLLPQAPSSTRSSTAPTSNTHRFRRCSCMPGSFQESPTPGQSLPSILTESSVLSAVAMPLTAACGAARLSGRVGSPAGASPAPSGPLRGR
jgi:hypothetical protein